MTGIIVIFLICFVLILRGMPGYFDPRRVPVSSQAGRCTCPGQQMGRLQRNGVASSPGRYCPACSGTTRGQHYRG